MTAPKGQNTRPTQDYVRESLFNIIQRDVPDANVLDLFAGSGALALEALSRGAAHAVLADKAMKAVDCIRRNTSAAGFEAKTDIRLGDWAAVLERLPAQLFDLVFLDPPYSLTLYREITQKLLDRKLLANDALIVIEHRKDKPVALSPVFVSNDYRTYGDTVIHFYRLDTGGHNDGT